MDKYLESFQEFFGPLSNAQRAMFIGLMVMVIAVIGGIFYWSQQTNYSLLFGKLQPDAAQEIVTELKNQGVDYEMREGGAIFVSDDQVHELRMQLASLGTSASSDVKGYELFDTNALGMTDFMQQVNKKRALEGELARSINSLEQVEFSRIHLVLPERSPFEDAAVEASASVILNIKRGKKLNDDQIQGITGLIAGSVETLEASNVTVLDQAGNRLTDEINMEDELGFGSTQMQLRQKTEAYLTERGQSMLDRVLGAGNSILRVSVSHNFDRLLRESDLIDPDSRTIISEETREQQDANEQSEPLPLDQRIPADQRGGAVVVSSNENTSTSETRNYEVNRTREVFEKTQGELESVTASVLLNFKKVVNEGPEGEEQVTYEPYPEVEIEGFREVVMMALGMQEERGDQLSIKQVEFFDREFVNNASYFVDQPTSYNDIFRWSIIGLTFIAVMLLINNIRKKMGDDNLTVMSEFKADKQVSEGQKQQALNGQEGQGQALKEGEAAASLPESKGPKQLPERKYSKEEIINFVEVKPAEAAQVVRAMIND
ncbi:MAG: flagellar M-ring protein FliF [Balneola sp.]|nr:flagellar M-ring protein FliF [Balneola sp.]|tara:strand:+ start:52123 stop:53760 length:1638 start_codon:yes stop_codon:yes gene_type:complete